MVVVTPVAVDRAAAEERLQKLQRLATPRALGHDELGADLPPERHDRAPVDRDAEASFAVDEPGDPALKPEPFLLIICTRHVVTTVAAGSDGYGE